MTRTMTDEEIKEFREAIEDLFPPDFVPFNQVDDEPEEFEDGVLSWTPPELARHRRVELVLTRDEADLLRQYGY